MDKLEKFIIGSLTHDRFDLYQTHEMENGFRNRKWATSIVKLMNLRVS